MAGPPYEEISPIPLIGLPGSDLPTITRIPEPPLTEEQLNLESMRLAVEWSARYPGSTEQLCGFANDIKEYIRPTTD